MYDLSPYYRPIELDDGMVRIYGKVHLTDLKDWTSFCVGSSTAAYYFISRYLDKPIDGEKVLTELVKLQDTDPNSYTYGCFHYCRGEKRIQDTNAGFFTTNFIALALLMCPEKITPREKEILAPALERATAWFRQECSTYGYFYPNKIASDGSLLMLLAAVQKNEALLAEAYDFWNKYLDYTEQYGWGWGENTSKGYVRIINNAFELALICMDPACETYARLLKIRNSLLDYMAFHDYYELTPSIRTYNFKGSAKVNAPIEELALGAGLDGINPADLADEDGKLSDNTMADLLLHWAAPKYIPKPNTETFRRERIFGDSYATTYKGKNIRLGTVSRYPVMCGCDQNRSERIGGWGLGWQSMPVSAVAVNHETSFLRYAAMADGEMHSHMATAYIDKTLFPDENIVDTYTFSAQDGSCAVVARMVEHIANRASYFADEWYFQHFDGKVQTVDDWFVFNYGDCALALKSLTGKLELVQNGENIRLVNKLYEGEDKLLVCRRFISCWAAVALDSTVDIEGQLAKIPASAEKILDLRYSREDPCLRLTCGSAVLNFDPDKTDLI